MQSRAVHLSIAGQSYRVVSSADEAELTRLAEAVSAKVAEVAADGRVPAAQAVVLAALALAHELEEERAERVRVEQRTHEMLTSVLGRIDDALGTSE